MELRVHQNRLIALILVSLGFTIALILAGIAIFLNVESTFYGFNTVGDASLSSLHCPVIITSSEKGYVTATFANTSSKFQTTIVDIEISHPANFRTFRTEIPLAVGESKRTAWEITSEDVDLGSFIFASVYVYANYPQRSRHSTCGTLVVNLPGIPGWFVLGFPLVISIFCILFGLWMWERSFHPIKGKPLDLSRGMTFLAVVTFIAMFLAFQGWWLAGIVALVIVVLGISAIIFFAFVS